MCRVGTEIEVFRSDLKRTIIFYWAKFTFFVTSPLNIFLHSVSSTASHFKKNSLEFEYVCAFSAFRYAMLHCYLNWSSCASALISTTLSTFFSDLNPTLGFELLPVASRDLHSPVAAGETRNITNQPQSLLAFLWLVIITLLARYNFLTCFRMHPQ